MDLICLMNQNLSMISMQKQKKTKYISSQELTQKKKKPSSVEEYKVRPLQRYQSRTRKEGWLLTSIPCLHLTHATMMEDVFLGWCYAGSLKDSRYIAFFFLRVHEETQGEDAMAIGPWCILFFLFHIFIFILILSKTLYKKCTKGGATHVHWMHTKIGSCQPLFG